MPNVPLPEWAKAGTKVAIIRRGHNTDDIKYTTITRVTKTSVFVEGHNGERRFVTGTQYSYQPEELREYGTRYGYGSSAHLYKADSINVVNSEKRNARVSRKNETVNHVERLAGHYDSKEHVAAAIKALQEWEKTL